MTVEELIIKLEELDPELEVYTEIEDDYIFCELVRAVAVRKPWSDDVEVVILSTEEV